MGLLLGASVLTLCELFDHLIILAYLRFCRSDKTKNNKKGQEKDKNYDGYAMA